MSHITTARRSVRACLLGLLLAVAVLSLSGCASSGESDSALAYCLATAQQAKFVDAAAAIVPPVTRGRAPGTIASPQGDLTIADWRAGAGNGPKFDRVCDAISPAEPPNDLVSALIAVGNIAVGALLALLSASTTARVTRRRQVSDSLRESARRFTRAMDSLVTHKTSRATQGLTESDVLDRMSLLEAALLRAGSLRPRGRPQVRAALQKLEEFTSTLYSPWPESPTKKRKEHGEVLTNLARSVQQRVEAIATGLDHAWWRRLPPEQP